MREIKFRVWFPEVKEGNKKADVYHEYYKNGILVGKTVSQEDIHVEGKPARMEVIDMSAQHNDTTEFYIAQRDGIVMQFTGLKDKNGKEIFEGDIVEFRSRVGEVTLPDNTEIVEDLWKFAQLCKGKFNVELTVFGNIYEHPNLLNHE